MTRKKPEAVDEGMSLRLMDVVQTLRDSPPVERRLPRRWEADAVDRLPRAQHELLAPLPGIPGACEKLVPEGSPVPPGADVLHALAVEMVAEHGRLVAWQQRDQRINDEHLRLADLGRMEAEIAEQRDRANARLDQLEAMEPVEPFDWDAVTRRAWKLCEVVPVPYALADSQAMSFTPAVLDRDEARVNYMGLGERDNLGRWVTNEPAMASAKGGTFSDGFKRYQAELRASPEVLGDRIALLRQQRDALVTARRKDRRLR